MGFVNAVRNPGPVKVPMPTTAGNGQMAAISVAGTADIPVGGGLVISRVNPQPGHRKVADRHRVGRRDRAAR